MPSEAGESGCVNCYERFEKAKGARQLNLRAPGVGLAYPERVGTSEVVFIVLALSTVTLDGFKETEAWQSVKDCRPDRSDLLPKRSEHDPRARRVST